MSEEMKVGSFTTSNDFKKLRDRKNQKIAKKPSTDLTTSVIIEEG